MDNRNILTILSELKVALKEDLAHLQSSNLQAVSRQPDPKSLLIRELETAMQALPAETDRSSIERELRVINQLSRQNEVHFRALQNGLQSLVSRIGSYRSDASTGAYDQSGANVSFQRGTGGYIVKV